MVGFSVELSAETASFRDPGGQLYHSTLPLPPITTLIGIAGAALGMPFPQVWKFFKENDLSVGIKEISAEKQNRKCGKGLDLWKYQKIVTKEVRSDIVIREFIFRPVYRLFFSGAISEKIDSLYYAFLAPAWAISLGTSDDIAYIARVSMVKDIYEEPGGSINLGCSLIPGDHSENYSFNWESINSTPIRTSLSLPVVKQLPVDFVFESDGERKGTKYKPFTFLSDTQQLKKPCSAYRFGSDVIALFSVGDDTFREN